MTVVVADTSPLRYLVIIGEIDLLPRLFGQVIIPDVVRTELRHIRTPGPVRDWIDIHPPWLHVESARTDPALLVPGLDAGEQAAIGLGISLRADLLLMDDRKGVVAAIARGLRTIGTLGVIDLAARRGLVDLPTVVARLRVTNFRIRPELLDELLEAHRIGGGGP